MNRFTHYNSDLDAFTSYHLEAEPSNTSSISGPTDETNALIAGTSGAVGTAISNIAVYPIDLVVKRLQVQRQLRSSSTSNEKGGVSGQDDGQRLYTDFSDAVRRIYKEEGGIAAFYSGCLHDTANSMGNAFLYFVAYNFMRDRRLQARTDHTGKAPKTLGMVEEISIGMLAGGFSRFLTAPVSNVVTRKQIAAMQSSSKTASSNETHTRRSVLGTREIVKDIYEDKGITGFWSGYRATIFLTLNPAITLFLYETLKTILPRRFREQPTAGQAFLIGAVAKAAANTFMYPFSLAKSRGQAQKKTSSSGSSSVIAMLQDIYRKEGVTGLYEGVQGEVMKGFFQNGITMLIKEFIHRNILSLYFFLSRLRDRSPDQSLPSAIYEKTISETPQQTADRLANASQDALNSAKSSLSNTKENVASALNTAKENVSSAVSTAKDNITSAADYTKENVASAISTTKETLSSAVDSTKQNLGNAAEVSKNSVNNMVNSATGTFQEQKDNLVENIQSGYEQVQTNLGKVVEKGSEMVKAGQENISQTTIDARRNLAGAIDVEKEPVGDVSREIGGIEWKDEDV